MISISVGTGCDIMSIATLAVKPMIMIETIRNAPRANNYNGSCALPTALPAIQKAPQLSKNVEMVWLSHNHHGLEDASKIASRGD